MLSNKVKHFEEALGKFQFECMRIWYVKVGVKIGLSIQLKYKEQNSYSNTRACDNNPNADQATKDLINSHCKKVLDDEENLMLCNKLDYGLKTIVDDHFSETKKLKRITCRCHKGISNIIIPIEFKDDIWYIFIGHILIKPLDEDIDKYILSDLRFEGLNLIPDSMTSYIQSDFTISPEIYSQYFSQYKDLAYIQLYELVPFIVLVRERFRTFLIEVDNNRALKQGLTLYKQKSSKTYAENKCNILFEHYYKLRDEIGLSKNIETLLTITKNKLKKNSLTYRELKNINDWLIDGEDGELNNISWIDRGKSLFKKEWETIYA